MNGLIFRALSLTYSAAAYLDPCLDHKGRFTTPGYSLLSGISLLK